MPNREEMVSRGAANLLVNCAGTRKHDRVLIVREQPGLGYYDEEIVSAVERAARAMGAHVTVRQVPFEPQCEACQPSPLYVPSDRSPRP